MVESNKEIIFRKIKQYFPTENLDNILSILNDEFAGNEERVQLAVLKLSEGSIEKLRRTVIAAKDDWRDVLAWAEYSEEMANETWKMETEAVNKIRERDRKQYLDWLDN